MNASQKRRLTAVDALILMATVALGSAWLIEAAPLLELFAINDRFLFRQSLHSVAAFFAPPTLALLLLRFRQPRPPMAFCLRQPGTVSCVVAAIMLIVELGNYFLNFSVRFGDFFHLLNFCSGYARSSRRLSDLTLSGALGFSVGAAPGLAVAGAYLALWSAGLWRPESSWIDRAGRVVGWFWILVALAFILLPPSVD
jgi:hypothetical protein